MRASKANPKGPGQRLKQPVPVVEQHSLTQDELRRENEGLRKEIERLREKVAESGKQISDRDRQIADLERQLAGRKKDSTNSSKPPSSDGPAAARRLKPARSRGRRKPGGQPGHPGKHRRLVPPERVDQVVPVLPVDCRHCGTLLPQQLNHPATMENVHRYQVTELPPMRAHITEYQCHKVACPNCRQTTRAELPTAIRASSFGPRLAGLAAYLTVGLRIPRRGVEQVPATALGIEMR